MLIGIPGTLNPYFKKIFGSLVSSYWRLIWGFVELLFFFSIIVAWLRKCSLELTFDLRVCRAYFCGELLFGYVNVFWSWLMDNLELKRCGLEVYHISGLNYEYMNIFVAAKQYLLSIFILFVLPPFVVSIITWIVFLSRGLGITEGCFLVLIALIVPVARNLTEEERKGHREIKWDDKEVCGCYMVRFCPHDLFVNTRSDLGKVFICFLSETMWCLLCLTWYFPSLASKHLVLMISWIKFYFASIVCFLALLFLLYSCMLPICLRGVPENSWPEVKGEVVSFHWAEIFFLVLVLYLGCLHLLWGECYLGTFYICIVVWTCSLSWVLLKCFYISDITFHSI